MKVFRHQHVIELLCLRMHPVVKKKMLLCQEGQNIDPGGGQQNNSGKLMTRLKSGTEVCESLENREG